jgi:hypothetical protein
MIAASIRLIVGAITQRLLPITTGFNFEYRVARPALPDRAVARRGPLDPEVGIPVLGPPGFHPIAQEIMYPSCLDDATKSHFDPKETFGDACCMIAACK